MPIQLIFSLNFDKYFQAISSIGGRYVLIAGGVFLFFYIVFKNKILAKKIQNALPKSKDYIREFVYSISTILIFGLIKIN